MESSYELPKIIIPKITMDEYWRPSLRHERLEQYSLAVKGANEIRYLTYISKNRTFNLEDVIRFVPNRIRSSR